MQVHGLPLALEFEPLEAPTLTSRSGIPLSPDTSHSVRTHLATFHSTMSVSPSRRSLDLQYAIPTLKLTVLILRIIQFVAVLTLSILYSTSHPPVYYDLLVWPQNATPPYNITVYRNMTKTYRQKVLLDELQPANTTWFERGATEPLTGQHWSTGEENGEENLAMERMGWADSEGFEPHSWLKSVVHLDRYIFFFLMGAVSTHLKSPGGYRQ